MNNNLTDVTLIVDRSGSMITCKIEAENGVNTFISEQKKQPGECTFTLVQFDTVYDFVFKGQNIQDVGTYTLCPRGWTALLDAVGRAINETGERLAAMPEDQRPGLVTFVIVTDGQENSSHEFTLAKIKEMIEHQQSVYSWKFTFLGANQDAFATAGSLGIPKMSAATYNAARTDSAFLAAANNVSRMRYAVGPNGPAGPAGAKGAAGVECSYTDEERKTMQL